MIKKQYESPINFGLNELDETQYESKVYEKDSLRINHSTKESNIDDIKQQMRYSEFSLTGEIARYLNNENVSCLMVSRILRESMDGAENIVAAVMTVILGNLLDNAIEALRQSENKRLLLSMKLTRGIVRIDIENSYNPKQKKKADQKQHGIGLLSVSHTLEKYHGDLKHYVEDNNKYHTTVTMFNGTE